MHFSTEESRCFLGGVAQSLERLPRWYQIFALNGIFFVIYLRHSPVISWLAIHLHYPLGSEWFWPTEYRVFMEEMSFNERLGFTLYGVSLIALVILLYKSLCKATKIGWAASHFFPNRRAFAITMGVLMCVVEVLRLREDVAACLSRTDSLAHIALRSFDGLERSGYDPRLAARNRHFLIQAYIFYVFVKHIVTRRLPLVLIAAALRLAFDMPRKLYAALRWYMVSIVAVFSLNEFVRMYFSTGKGSIASWGLIVWSALFLGVVNYLYGPVKRAGMMATLSTYNACVEAVRGFVVCTVMWNIASLLVLTFLVSVHVVELIGIWLIIFLLIVWIPAATDSCSLEYITLLSCSFAYLTYRMQYLSAEAAMRLGMMVSVWWLVISLAYNVVANALQTRYAGMVTVVWICLCVFLPQRPTGDWPTHIEGSIMNDVFTEGVLWLYDIAAFRDPSTRRQGPHEEGNNSKIFYYVMRLGLGISAFLVAVATLIGLYQPSEVRTRLRYNNLVLVNVSVLIQKVARAAVLLFCLLASLVPYYIVHQYLFLYNTQVLSSVVCDALAIAFGCTTLGALMDIKETLYKGIMRFLGLVNPPKSEDEIETSAGVTLDKVEESE